MHRRRAAVVGDRHVLVVRHERRFRPAAHSGVDGMLDAGEEVGEVAHHCRQVQDAVHRAVKELPGERLDLPAFGAVRGKQCGEALAQRGTRRAPQCHQRIERRARRGSSGLFRLAGEQLCSKCRLQIEDLVPDRNAAARRAPSGAEYAQWQILDRKFRVTVRRSDPARALGIMRLVSQSIHCLPFIDRRALALAAMTRPAPRG